MKRILLLAVILFVVGARPALAQPGEIAALRAELAKQQAVIAQLLQRLDALEKQKPSGAAAAPASAAVQELQDDLKAQEDSVNSLREIVNNRVNVNGYYNFRFSADGSEEPTAFQ